VSSSKRPPRKAPEKTGRDGQPPPLRRPSGRPPAAARLTIKPGRPRTAWADHAPPPRQRPGGSRRLSEVQLEEDEVLLEGFDALLNGVEVRITAVLERTCVYQGAEGDRRLATKSELWVEADKLPIRRRGIG